ncbi:MND1-interacting protein 1-like [Solanum stenotomum]|uniref:MND1-interacting protein 1-like n=1 Tax=Solanum stenotomum TaxID=172797 RepID=UPI0020D069CC|nr:MND1-interacting protein 1-like [Solanum stenotomum]XP_049376387.1 MND1-interacting protein 1-like [Solanum stenotomum]
MSSKEKYIRNNRRLRSARIDHDFNTQISSKSNSLDFSGISESGVRQLNPESEIAQQSNPINVGSDGDSGSGSGIDESGLNCCTEDQLEDILLQNLEVLYSEAVTKLMDLGYDEEVAMRAILKNGHCYGGMDVLTNILHNSLSYLNNGYVNSGSSSSGDESDQPFVDLRQLEEYSLAGMICLLQQMKPHLSKVDAMWCLLVSDLHVGRASVMEIPDGSGRINGSVGGGSSSSTNVEGVATGPIGVVPAMCRFHGGWGFGNSTGNAYPLNKSFAITSDSSSQKDIDCPKRFNLTPSMKTLLKRNVAAFTAGFRSNPKYMQRQSRVSSSSLADGDQSSGLAQSGGSQTSKSQDVVNCVVGKFQDLNLDENTQQQGKRNEDLDQKDEMLLSLLDQIKDLEKQVKERKDWAHQKAMQAARKLSHDLTELKMLRMEKEDIQRMKKGKPAIEDATMKKLSEMETSLRTASANVDRSNMFVKTLQEENAEMKAELEASKLSASESAKKCAEAAKREKKCLKKLGVWDKQKKKLQEEIAAEKQKISDLQNQLAQSGVAIKDAEVNWRQEQKARQQASALVDEERRFKEATEANNKRKLEELRSKAEIDFQRHKDDLQRLEQDLSRLRASTELQNQSANVVTGSNAEQHPHGDIARMLHELANSEENSPVKDDSRECIMCMKHEVSVVFLPCAHQVLCSNCNDNFGKKGRVAKCPCCRAPIERRIRVFGATS